MKQLIHSKNLYQKLQKQYNRKINLDLKRINLSLKELKNIHYSIKNPINIIGSDGKNSVVQILKCFIEQNKERVTTFTSPHLYDVRHRIWLKDRFISLEDLKKNIKVIKKLKIKLTLFELLSLVYFISAAKLKNVSYSLVEAGLMFAGDSTNVWDEPRCQIVTNINKQHLEWTKSKTLREIIKQKVGYLSTKTNIYIGKQEIKTMKTIKKILSKNKSKKFFYGNDWIIDKNKKIYKDKKGEIILKYSNILSEAMWDNLSLSIFVARNELNISKQVILKAIPKIKFEGRIQWLTKGKLIKKIYPNEKLLIDGCHSEMSAKNLASYLKSLNKDVYAIWGMQRNKKPEIFIKQFKGIFNKIVTVKIPNEPNACTAEELRKIANENNISCDVAANIPSAIKTLSSNKEKIITCFGSLFLAGKILSLN